MKPFFRIVLLALLSLTTSLTGCGGQGSEVFVPPSASGREPAVIGEEPTEAPDEEDNVGLSPPPPPPPPGTVVYGRFLVLPVLPLETVDPDVREALKGVRARLEERGMVLLDNALAWPLTPASGWTIRLGEQTLLCDESGAFSLTVPEGVSTFAVLHPSAEPEGGVMAPVEVAIGEFTANQEEAVTMVIPIGFRGPCGMTPGDTDEICRALPQPVLAQQRAPRYTPPLWVPPDGPGKFTYGVLRGPLGTYPPDRQYRTPDCPDTDGTASIFVSTNFASVLKGLTGKSGGELLTYIGSICDLNVLNGACLHENDLSDLEEEVATGLARALGLKITQPGRRGTSTGGTCFFNHKGRVCGMFLVGDVSVDLGDRIVKAGELATIQVLPGDAGSFTVHNNGAFGLTNIRASRAGVLALQSAYLESGKLGPLTFQLRHFDGRSGPYEADRVVSYRVPENAQPGDDVTFDLQVDDLKVTLRFEVGGISITPGFTNLRGGQRQRFEALLGGYSPEGLTFEWALAQGTGSLSATSGRAVTYTPREDLKGVFFDTLRLRVFAPGPSGQKVERATATAQIRYSASDVGIAPTSVRLVPGESQTFQIFTTQPPEEELSYEWTATGNLGSLSAANRPSVTYLVRDDVNPPATVQLKAVVYAGVGAARTKVGEATAVLDIVQPANGERVLLRVTSGAINESTLFGYSLDLATGRLSSAATSLTLTPRNVGFGESSSILFSPQGERVYYSRLVGGVPGVEVIDIDPQTGAFNVADVVPLTSSIIAVSEGSLCALGPFQTGVPTDIIHHDLDANGSPVASGAILSSGPQATVPGFRVVTSPQGGEYVYSLNQGRLYGYRVQNGSATPVSGSPFTVFSPGLGSANNSLGVHPEMTSVLVVQNNPTDGGAVALHSVRLDPSDGSFIGLGGLYTYPDSSFAFGVGSIAVSESGVVAFNKNNQVQLFTVSSSGALGLVASLRAGGLNPPALDPSGQYLLDWTSPGDGGIYVETYRIGSSGAALVNSQRVDRTFDIITRSASD